jgi:spermidine synthase
MLNISLMHASRRTLVGLGLICFANLLLSVLMTRLFSATMFYHFTFLAVALAMFGVAASGVYVFIKGERLTNNIGAALSRASTYFAIATVLATIYSLANPIDILFYFGTSRVPEFQARQFWQLVLLIAISAAPFFFAGLVVSLCLTVYQANVNRVYFFDLVGAALAALVVGLMLRALGGPNAMLSIAVLALIAGQLFAPRRGGWVAPVLMAVVIAANTQFAFISVPSGKGVASEKVRFEAWNIFSRVTVDQGLNIKIDASAATQITNLNAYKAGGQQGEITALAHGLFPEGAEKVLIIGPGGGRDVLHALDAGARHVIGVEINPIIAETIMRERFAKQSGRLYFDSRVRIVTDDGRSFVRRSTDRYDLLQASLVDTFAATAAGAFALSENTLYTVEAFDDYFAHLTDRGALTMTRWHTGDGNETARLLLLAAAGLERRGVARGKARDYLFYAIAPKTGLGTLVARVKPFTVAELDLLEEVVKANGWTIVVSPRTARTTVLEQRIDDGPYGTLVSMAREDLSPPTDDRPFFFYFKRFGDLFRPSKKMNDPSLWILVSLGSVLFLSIGFIVLPLVVRAIRGGVDSPESSFDKLLTLLYFGLVGFAFMAIEIGLLQRMTLFLGHPSYSLVVVLFTVLLATGLGAFIAERIPVARLGHAMAACGLGLALLAAFYAYLVPGVIHALIAQSLPVRILIAGALIAPSGLIMGTMIPNMVRILANRGSRLTPWGWGVNGATSVLGSVVSTVVAIYGGFSSVFAVGGVVYLLSGIGGLLVARRALGAASAPPGLVA